MGFLKSISNYKTYLGSVHKLDRNYTKFIQSNRTIFQNCSFYYYVWGMSFEADEHNFHDIFLHKCQ